MANIAPANFAYVNANGDKGDVQVLSDADIILLNKGLQDIEDLKLAVQKPLPVATVIPFVGNIVPDGFLICNGAAVSRTTYASLFAAIGTLYGVADGSTNFSLPDFRDRVLQGASSTHATGSYIAAGLPNVAGSRIMQHDFIGDNWQGALAATYIDTSYKLLQFQVPAHVNAKWIYSFDASRSNALYGASTTVQMSAGAVQYLIKY